MCATKRSFGGTITARSSKLHGTIIGGDLIPRMIDEIPVFAVAACCAEGETVIRDASELLYKESNRIMTTATELQKTGADITPTEDGFLIRGGPLHGAPFDSHFDHRIAMAMAVAALAADTPSEIGRSEAVDISYPEFFDTLIRLASGEFRIPHTIIKQGSVRHKETRKKRPGQYLSDRVYGFRQIQNRASAFRDFGLFFH